MRYFILILFLSACTMETEEIDLLENLDLEKLPENSSISIGITKFIFNIFPVSTNIGTKS